MLPNNFWYVAYSVDATDNNSLSCIAFQGKQEHMLGNKQGSLKGTEV